MNANIEAIAKTRKQIKTPEGGIEKKTLPVTGMTCASCAASVESMIASQEGVIKAGSITPTKLPG